MRIRLHRRNGGWLLGWIILVLLVVAALIWALYKAYMWTHPKGGAEPPPPDVLPFIAIPATNPEGLRPRPQSGLLVAPDGWTYKPCAMLTSTNLVDWEMWEAPLRADGTILYQDGSLLTITQEQNPTSYLWNQFRLIMVAPGTNGARFFKPPF